MKEPIFAFFDECGEEGFSDKASEWFILSAAIQGAEDFEQVVECYDRYKAKSARQDNWHFHFVKTEHRTRLGFVEGMREAGHVFMSVAVHKRSLTRTDNFSRPYYLYFFAAKLLLERISWMCRSQDRYLAIAFFSTRRGLRHELVADYLQLLQRNEAGLNNSIHWPAVKNVKIVVEPNKSRVGLQLADLMASSFGNAISPDVCGITEPRYLCELKEQIYNFRKSYLSYGLKFFPRLPDELRQQDRFAWLSEFGH